MATAANFVKGKSPDMILTALSDSPPPRLFLGRLSIECDTEIHSLSSDCDDDDTRVSPIGERELAIGFSPSQTLLRNDTFSGDDKPNKASRATLIHGDLKRVDEDAIELLLYTSRNGGRKNAAGLLIGDWMVPLLSRLFRWIFRVSKHLAPKCYVQYKSAINFPSLSYFRWEFLIKWISDIRWALRKVEMSVIFLCLVIFRRKSHRVEKSPSVFIQSRSPELSYPSHGDHLPRTTRPPKRPPRPDRAQRPSPNHRIPHHRSTTPYHRHTPQTEMSPTLLRRRQSLPNPLRRIHRIRIHHPRQTPPVQSLRFPDRTPGPDDTET